VDLAALPLKRCVSELYNAYAGQPILVIGGGPSVLTDLSQISGWQSMVQISANGHAFKLPEARPSFIFTKDNAECPPRPRNPRAGPFPLMEPQMRVFGVPIISLQYWADYRCASWPFQGNSGQHALAVGVLMGGAPVIGVGFDCFQGPTYFHSDGPNVSAGRNPGYWQYRFRRFAERFRCQVRIRALSGQVAETFGKYNPAETFTGEVMPAVFLAYEKMPTQRVRVLKAFRDSGKATEIPAGAIVACSPAEAALWCARGLAEPRA